MRLLYGEPERVAAWVTERIPDMVIEAGTYQAIGIVDDSENLIAGVIYNHYTGSDISMHVAAEHGRLWAKPEILHGLFAFPFNQLNCRRVTGFVDSTNLHTLSFDQKLGFRIEGRLRDATPHGDMFILGMTRKECRWLETKNGKIDQNRSAA
ncbi:GNAT family N-acetyltransferase [Dyella marensis]|uniref:GNAT family N-acetyltransferase n=1 Tax=Dyella marensis TaxID=500610 RepID=UPI0031D2A1DD